MSAGSRRVLPSRGVSRFLRTRCNAGAFEWERTMTKYTWEHIHLRSPDPATTADWYADKLGAEVIRTPQPDGSTRIDLDLTGQKIFIAKADPASTGASRQAPYMWLDHFGLTVPDIDNAVAELKAKGVVFKM